MSVTGEEARQNGIDSAKGHRPPERKLNQWAATLAAAVVLGVLICARRLVDPAEPLGWSYQLLTFWLVLAAGIGRALVGFRGRGAEESREWRWPRAAIWAAILAAAVLPYVHSLTVGFLSDDFGLMYAARNVGGPLEAMRSPAYVTLYRPLSLLIWWIGTQLWAGVPIGYHAVSVAIHACNALLVYALGRRLMGSAYGGFLAALLFAVHPLHVEPVTWICSHADLLYTMFGLLSLLSLEVYLTSESPRKWLGLVAGVVAVFLALLSKEAAVALPAAALLRVVALPARPIGRRVVTVGAAYMLPVAVYLPMYFSAIGGVGGYRHPLTFWNTVFPSAPLNLMGDFLFPVHRLLFAAVLGKWVWCGAMVVLAAGVLWWVRGLERVPARRLWLWMGFLLVTSLPVWVFSATGSGILEASRRAYLPTIGLAWLFGDICAGRGIGWRRSGGVAAAMVIGATALTIWYVVPWRQGGAMAQEIVAAGEGVLGELSESGEVRMLYVEGLPEMEFGVPVFRNCYPQALSLATGGRVGTTVGAMVVSAQDARGVIHPEVLASRTLRPGEHIVAWRPEAGEMEVVRRGGE